MGRDAFGCLRITRVGRKGVKRGSVGNTDKMRAQRAGIGLYRRRVQGILAADLSYEGALSLMHHS